MKHKTREMIFIAMFAALTAAGAFIRIPIGPVPITLQNLFTALSGVILGPVAGAISQLVYILLGMMGLPVFASGAAGPSAVFTPSFGYLAGFAVCPLLTGVIVGHSAKPPFWRILAGAAAGMLLIYAIGLPYLYVILKYEMQASVSLSAVIKTGFLVFLPGDLLKCLLAALIGRKLIPIYRGYLKNGENT